jgi:hypothetical protein
MDRDRQVPAWQALPALPESLDESLGGGTVSAGSILEWHVIRGSCSSQKAIAAATRSLRAFEGSGPALPPSQSGR